METLSYKIAIDCDKDFEDFYKIKCDPENIKWGGFICSPNNESFRLWYSNVLKNDDREIYLVYKGPVCVAFFYIDYLDDNTIEDTSGVLSQYAGQGVGTYIIEQIDMIARKKRIQTHIAWISDKNIGSSKRYVKLGYKRTEEKDYRNLPLLGGVHTFYKWIKKLDNQ